MDLLPYVPFDIAAAEQDVRGTEGMARVARPQAERLAPCRIRSVKMSRESASESRLPESCTQSDFGRTSMELR